MLDVIKRIITDENDRPIAVQVDYGDWVRIEQELRLNGGQKPPTNLAVHAGRVDWPVDGLDYQRSVRGEWS